jgi:uncharacterized protein (TIGR02001 family)
MRNAGLKTLFGAGALMLMLAGRALAADLPVKAGPPPAPAAPDFDIAFGGGIMSDYVFRGITQSAHGASPFAYFEPRYKEFYVGIAGTGINFKSDPNYGLNDPTAEVDFYGGWRPTIGKWTFDVGYIYYYYPKPVGFSTDFYEIYGKVSYAVTDALTIGGAVYYSPDLLNTGFNSDYWEVNAKYVLPSAYFAPGWGMYLSGAYGYFHVNANDTTMPSYQTWNLGGGFTWKAFTLDLRWSDTDLNKGAAGSANACATFWAGGPGTQGWCNSTFAAKLSFDLLASALK